MYGTSSGYSRATSSTKSGHSLLAALSGKQCSDQCNWSSFSTERIRLPSASSVIFYAPLQNPFEGAFQPLDRQNRLPMTQRIGVAKSRKASCKIHATRNSWSRLCFDTPSARKRGERKSKGGQSSDYPGPQLSAGNRQSINDLRMDYVSYSKSSEREQQA